LNNAFRIPSAVWSARRQLLCALCVCALVSGCHGGGGATGAGTGGGDTTGSGGANGLAGSSGTGGGGITGSAGITGSGAGSGGVTASGGITGTGGMTGTGGVTALGGMTGGNVVRSITSFDSGWLFFAGDAIGADQPAFADTSWRPLNVPHDWSIEGPFSETATTTGRGGYLPAGVGWYRKHFTLPQSASGRNVFVEFDGVMANSDVYINGFHLGKRPYGYVSFRYDLTSHVMFGTADNVISVRCDNSVQPASRWYTGAGIYRHVRVIMANPVHVAQYATFVTTPTATAASATVHVQTAVINAGTTAQGVSVQGIVSDPGGTALAPVATPAQNVAAGATGTFTFDVPVSNPKLWDIGVPNMYQLVTNVQVGGATLDDDVTPFGIRTVTWDGTTGLNLNGKNVKLKGVGIHQEMSGLGIAVPERAWQRRLAEFKALGVNAIRTAHNPFAPEFLDLADRMGLVVLDEFFDAWIAHKYTDVGDYAAYFNVIAPATTGSPSAGAGATWWQTDVTDILMRDRNHPSVAIYSMGNEMHESITVRTPYATKMAALCHALDPTRPVTQALLDPATAGDVTGATRTIVDVFGSNYDVNSIVSAIAMTPRRAGLITEVGHSTSTWTTVLNNPALTGMFLWTGADYLGEANLAWPTIGSSAGIMDRVGTVKADGYAYQSLWGATVTPPPATGTTATKVTLAADHATLLTDANDVTYVKATITDASGRLVTSAGNAVTFGVMGPGTIVAVDSGSQTQESFRGTQRNAYQGICFAIIRATGPGAITVTASAAGLTGSATTTVQASAGTFVPCSNTCD
jgi:beta-galactosidase